MRISAGVFRPGALVVVALFLVASVSRGQSIPSANRLTAAALPSLHSWPVGKPRSASADPIVYGGLIVFSVRGVDGPRDVTIWSRSGNLSFFEVAPLVGVLADATVEELEEILQQPTEPSSSPARARRALIAQTVRASGLTRAPDVVKRHKEQRAILERPYDSVATSAAVARLFPTDPSVPITQPAQKPPVALPPGDVWSRLAKATGASGSRQVAMRLTVLPVREARVVGYLLEVPPTVEGLIEADALVAFDDSEPERLSIKANFPSMPVSWIVRTGTSFAEMLGVLGGAVIGFGGFVLQQWYSRRAQVQRDFDRKKIELSKTIRKFFEASGNYETFRDQPAASETARVRNVRDALVDEGIYAILPSHVAIELNELARAERGRNLVTKMDKLLAAEFAEFR